MQRVSTGGVQLVVCLDSPRPKGNHGVLQSVGLPRPPTVLIGRAWRCPLRACRSVAQALEHEGKGDATGTEGVGDPNGFFYDHHQGPRGRTFG